MINGYFVSPDFCKMMGTECKDCRNKGSLSRQAPYRAQSNTEVLKKSD